MEQFRDRESRLGSMTDDRIDRDKTGELLRNLGADDVIVERVSYRINDTEIRSVVERLRAFAQDNPGVVLGALTALVAGGAVAGRAVATRRTKSRRRAAAKKSTKRSKGSAAASKSAKRSSRPAAASKTRSASKKSSSSKKRSSSKRTLIEPHAGDKRFIRRDARGRIKESVDVGRSLSADRRRHAKTKAKEGSGDKGDR